MQVLDGDILDKAEWRCIIHCIVYFQRVSIAVEGTAIRLILFSSHPDLTVSEVYVVGHHGIKACLSSVHQSGKLLPVLPVAQDEAPILVIHLWWSTYAEIQLYWVSIIVPSAVPTGIGIAYGRQSHSGRQSYGGVTALGTPVPKGCDATTHTIIDILSLETSQELIILEGEG